MEKNVTSLKEFIEDHKTLLTISGLFAALTSFFATSFPENNILSFSTFIMFLLICWELWVSFPASEKTSTNLKMFEFLFIGMLFGVIAQIVVSYQDILIMFLGMIFWIIYLLLIIKLSNKFKLFLFVRKMAEKDIELSPFIRSLTFIIVSEIALLLALLSKKLLFIIIK